MNEEAELLGTEGAEANTGEDAQAPAPVTPADPKVALRLCKGQMPSPLVWYIKFKEPQDNRSAVAAKYFTTPGKIADIQTNANQKYIVADMVFTAEELEQARARIRENFVRGQAEVAQGKVVSTRQLASTIAGDETYALSVIDIIAGLDKAEGAKTLAQSRAEHNAANPRKTAGAAAAPAENAATEGGEVIPPADDDLLDDDLLEDGDEEQFDE